VNTASLSGAARVQTVSTDVIRRRFDRSLHNFFSLYKPLADRWLVFDNSVAGKASLLATQEGNNPQIKEPKKWLKLQKRLAIS
jgi:predicted ABC-type ATPase